MEESGANRRTIKKVFIAVGTYEGVLAGWRAKVSPALKDEVSSKANDDTTGTSLEIQFASPVHGGSVRSLALATGTNSYGAKGLSTLVSTGYDEYMRLHDLRKQVTSSGEIRTPSDFGTPVCASFAPPTENSTHCVIGFTSGKFAIYKKRDWSIQHVLAGHKEGISAMAVHPSGKLALTGGQSDGKLILWDLMQGKLAYVQKLPAARSNIAGRIRYESITSIVWNTKDHNGESETSCYAFSFGSHITVRDVASGEDLLDVELPSRVNQLCFLPVEEGLFVVAACNDGSLPVLAVDNLDSEKDSHERRAIMAIEPVEGPVAGEERFKCLSHVDEYLVATANSAGVVSLMNLKGAVHMIMTQEESDGVSSDEDQSPVGDESDDDDDAEQELAVDILDSVQLGTGARITCLAATAYEEEDDNNGKAEESSEDENSAEKRSEEQVKENEPSSDDKKRKRKQINMDPEAVERARKLVAEAKVIQKKKRRVKK